MEHAEYIDPYSAGRGNSIRYLAIAPCDDTMQVQGMHNLFCGGEKFFHSSQEADAAMDLCQPHLLLNLNQVMRKVEQSSYDILED